MNFCFLALQKENRRPVESYAKGGKKASLNSLKASWFAEA